MPTASSLDVDNPLRLRYGGLVYWDRTLAIQQQSVTVPGLVIDYEAFDRPPELFRRQAQEAAFPVSEMSFSTYMLLRGKGDDRFVGLPIFLSRNFRHRQVYVSERSGIRHPEDLRGRRVGVPDYQLTAALWIRGFLQHDYGVEPSQLRWLVGGLRAPGYQERYAHPAPAGVSIERIPEDRCLEEMLASGDLDALVTVTPPPCLADGGCRRLFQDYVAVEREYFRRTGIFPIMHLVVCRRDVHDRYPGLAPALLELFERAKAHGRDRMGYRSCLAVGLPWLGECLDELENDFKGDAFPYGLAANRNAVEAAAAYAHEQGFTPRRLRLDELFSPQVLDT